MQKKGTLVNGFLVGILIVLMAAATGIGAPAQQQRTLGPASIGGDVLQLQAQLDKLGYDLKPFDGLFGLRTQAAVMDFQADHGLKPTGNVDRATAAALKKAGQPKKARPEQTNGSVRQAAVEVSRGYSPNDVLTLARAVHGEARGEKFEGQVAVAAVIVNRTQSGKFPDTINGVVFEPGAFDAVADGQIWMEPDNQAVEAAELALAGYDPTGGAIYYWNPATSTNKWIWSRPIEKRIGRHVFAR